MFATNAIDFFPSFCKLPVNYFIFALNKIGITKSDLITI
jgi:hypothetical protein